MTKSREEFERLFLILYKKWREWGKHTSAYGIGWDIWQAQQKKIDELEQQRDEAVELLQFLYDNIENIYTVESAIINYIQKAGKHE